MAIHLDDGLLQKIADLKKRFERCGYEWDLDMRINRWVKSFVDEASKAIDVVDSSEQK